MELKDIFPKDPEVRDSDDFVVVKGGDVADDDEVGPLCDVFWSYCCK